MTRRLACALLVLWSTSALEQEAQRPDFSGNWLLDKEKSRLQAPVPDNAVFSERRQFRADGRREAAV